MEACNDEFGGYRCSRKKGHEGRHAHAPTGTVEPLPAVLGECAPSRTEIAARILAGIAANPSDAHVQGPVAVERAVMLADLLLEHLDSGTTYHHGRAPADDAEKSAVEEARRTFEATVAAAIRFFGHNAGLEVSRIAPVRDEVRGQCVDIAVGLAP